MSIDPMNGIPIEIPLDGSDDIDDNNETFENNGLRRSTRIATNQTFTNIYGVENEGSEDSPPPVVVRFNRSLATTINFKEDMESGDLTYAPSNREPYYMAVHVSQFTQLFGNTPTMCRWATKAEDKGVHVPRANPNVALASFFNVSLKLFYDIARDQVDWLSLSCLEDPRITAETEIQSNEVQILKEMAFGQLVNPPNRDPIDGEPYNEPPPTDTDPEPTMTIEDEPLPDLDDQEQELKDIIDNTPDRGPLEWKIEKKKIAKEIADHGFRRAYVPIRHPKGWLIWVRLPNWKKDRQGRRGQLTKLKDAFKKIWMYSTATDPESVAGYRPRYSSADLGFSLYVVPSFDALTARLYLCLDEVDTLFRQLVGEINRTNSQLRTKLIALQESEVCEPHYYKMSENPFGLFTTYISADGLDKYMKSLEVLQGHSDLNPVPKNASRNNADHATVDRELGVCVRGSNPMSQKKYTKPQKAAVKSMNSQQGTWDKLQTYVGDHDRESSWRVDVTRAKISAARGKRNGKFSPKAIMGMSANDVATEALGWKALDKAEVILGNAHRIANGLYMAEWLHLCAFSWGGLTRLGTKGKELYQSSDIPGNLIIGTSETNSVMTRFEKAWQGLVIDESAQNDKFYAELLVTRNPDNELVKRDLRNRTTQKYFYGSSVMTKEEGEIADYHHFMAYTVSYSIKFPLGSTFLNMKPGSSLKTTFYPFLRPLYHTLEDQLDQTLYKRMGLSFRGRLILQGLSQISLNQSPYNTDGKLADDGTVLKGAKKKYGIRRHAEAAGSMVDGTVPLTKNGKMQHGVVIKSFDSTSSRVNDYGEVKKKLKGQRN